MPTPLISYYVDDQDRISVVSGGWLQFARDNGAPELTCEAVVGRSLFEFIEGADTRRLYRILMDQVRRTHELIVVPFRCDGPSMRRSMELTLSTVGRGVRFEARSLREETRSYCSILDHATPRNDESLAMCAVCNRILASGHWLEVEQAVKLLRLFDTTSMPVLGPGVCDSCERSLVEQHSLSH